jgi:hypothetical protein
VPEQNARCSVACISAGVRTMGRTREIYAVNGLILRRSRGMEARRLPSLSGSGLGCPWRCRRPVCPETRGC